MYLIFIHVTLNTICVCNNYNIFNKALNFLSRKSRLDAVLRFAFFLKDGVREGHRSVGVMHAEVRAAQIVFRHTALALVHAGRLDGGHPVFLILK